MNWLCNLYYVSLLWLQITHWQSPYMHAYFPALNSCPSLLGDMLADAIGCLGFTWVGPDPSVSIEESVNKMIKSSVCCVYVFMHDATDASSSPGVNIL